MTPKKGMTTNFLSPMSFTVVVGSRIRDPGWVKIRIRDKHPRSATLVGGQHFGRRRHKIGLLQYNLSTQSGIEMLRYLTAEMTDVGMPIPSYADYDE